MGVEITHAAVLNHPQLGHLAWYLWECPVGAENYRETDVGRHELIENIEFGLSGAAGAELIPSEAVPRDNFAVPLRYSTATLDIWLKDKPPDWGRAIAARVALRVLPLALTTSAQTRAHDLLNLFRANFVAWAALKYSGYDFQGPIYDAISTVSTGTKGVPHRSAIEAAKSIARQGSDLSTGVIGSVAAATNIAQISAEAAHDVWASVRADLIWLSEKGNFTDRLIDQPLWLIDVRQNRKFTANFPPWIRAPFDEFDKSKFGRGDWRVWTSWYRAILPNRRNVPADTAFGEQLDVAIGRQPAQFWERDPHEVVREIAKLIQANLYAPSGADPWTSNFVLALVESEDRAFPLGEIYAEFVNAGYSAPYAVVRDVADKLSAEGLIQRIASKTYASQTFEAQTHTTPEETSAPGEQRPAAHVFVVRDAKLHAAPWPGMRPQDAVTADIHADLVRQCKQLLERFPASPNTYFEQDAKEAIDRALGAIGEDLSSVREGLVVSVTRAFDSLVAWMQSPGASDEVPDWLLRSLPAIRGSLNDLGAQFPEAARIRASALALDLMSEDQGAVRRQVLSLQKVADASPLVDETARAALHALDADFAAASDAAEQVLDEKTRAAAIQTRGEILAEQVNSLRNFATALGGWAQREWGEVGAESWRRAKAAVPEAIGDLTKGGIKAAATFLVLQTFGVVAAMAVVVASLQPDRDRLKVIKDKLSYGPEGDEEI